MVRGRYKLEEVVAELRKVGVLHSQVAATTAFGNVLFREILPDAFLFVAQTNHSRSCYTVYLISSKIRRLFALQGYVEFAITV